MLKMKYYTEIKLKPYQQYAVRGHNSTQILLIENIRYKKIHYILKQNVSLKKKCNCTLIIYIYLNHVNS